MNPNGDSSLYTMLDVNTMLDMEVECDGIKKKPHIILKVYCKMGERERRSAMRTKALQAAREGSPILH